MIRETIITTINADGSVHIAPMGIREEDGLVVIAPFKPSTTLDNILRNRSAVVNMTDDVRIFAGCLTGRYDWPTLAVEGIEGYRLEQALSHMELQVTRFEEDEVRPSFYCSILARVNHRPFTGFNRAQSAVLEAAILVSRLHMLPRTKIEEEIRYLEIAVEKTAGPDESQAWEWLMQRVRNYYARDKNAEGEQVL